MIYYLSQYILELARGSAWEDWLSPLRVFRYITVRSAGAAVTALALSWWLGPRTIAWLRALKFQQEYLDQYELSTLNPQPSTPGAGSGTRNAKRGTPTMGGVLIVLVVDLAVLLWAQWIPLVVLSLVVLMALACLGGYDDYRKITEQNSRGTTERVKLVVQTVLATFIGLYLWMLPETRALVTDIMVPFFKHPVATGAVAIGLPLTVLAIVGSSNAVNLTDGLDGLAIGCTVIVSFVFLVLTYLAGHAVLANYLQIPFVPGAGELTVFCAALIGAGLGFLWFNCHPAQVFMGDTGSLALGGVLGLIAVLIHQPLILVIAGGVFVAEAVSVLIQRSVYKFTRLRYGTGRRVFRMAPLHHHFQEQGWDETKVVVRFYILCLLCAVLALSTLKIR